MNSESSFDQAATWAARLDAGPLDREQAGQLLQWLETDPANEGRLEEMQRLHGKVRHVLPDLVLSGRVPVRERRESRRPFFAWVAGAAAAVLVISVVWGSALRPAAFETVAAQRQVVTLTDGTVAELNAQTSIKVRMRGAERLVELERGEAFFSVAKDAARPFQVETAAGKVRVTGTVFNLRSHADDSLEVVLLEGAVEVTPTGGGVRRMVPGDAVKIAAGEIALLRLSSLELANAVAWRDGKVVLQDTPLADAVRRFADYHARPIMLAPEVRGLSLGGRFKIDDLEAFLRDLEVALPVTVRRGADGSIRIEATVDQKIK